MSLIYHSYKHAICFMDWHVDQQHTSAIHKNGSVRDVLELTNKMNDNLKVVITLLAQYMLVNELLA